MKRVWRGFQKGLSTPRLGPVATGFLAAGLLVGATEWALRQGVFGRFPLSYFLVNEFDQTTALTHRLSRLKLQENRMPVYFVGGSATREALISEASFNDALPEVQLFHFYSTQESFAGAMALIDQLPREPGWILLGMNPSRFSRSEQDYRTQLTGERLRVLSPTLREFAQGEGWDLPVNLLLPSYLRYAKKLFGTRRDRGFGKITLQTHFYDGERILTRQQRREFYEEFIEGRMAPQFDRYWEMNTRALEFLVKKARARGLTPVLVELPIWRTTRLWMGPVLRKYESILGRLQKDLDVEVWSGAHALSLGTEDFHDLFHLEKSGREKFQAYLLQQIRQRVENTFSKETL